MSKFATKAAANMFCQARYEAAERILNAMDNSPVPISWHEMDRMALQSVIAKELILIDKEARK